ncbi:MAG: hypothetical protein U9O98_06400 [Asgard group archaeon]|nr:hypothetical protein [Asgard group archaeon]
MKKCAVCNSSIEKGVFCDSHEIAKEQLDKLFPKWQKAFGKLSWKDYLQQLTTDEEIPIGDWAREVAEYLLKK